MSNLKDFFTPEDFVTLKEYKINFEFKKILMTYEFACKLAAIDANAKLATLIESSPVVYGYGENPGRSSIWNMNNAEKYTHTARLICIEELPQEPCKHQPSSRENIKDSNGNLKSHCQICGAKLVATWSEVK